MRNTLIFVNSLALAGFTTLMVAGLSLLYLMATTPQAGVRKTALFGGVSFETTTVDGGVNVTAGVDNIIPLLVLCAVLFVLYAGGAVALRSRR